MFLIGNHKGQNQYLASICVSFLGVSYGTAAGWSSPSIPILLAGETGNNLDPVSPEIASWISSVLCCGGLIGCFFFGYLCHRFGCKIAGYVATVPFITAWILIGIAENVYVLIIARTLAGFAGGGAFAIVPLFIAEMSEDRIRGTLVSFLLLSINCGILLAYILGYLVSYKMMCWILIVVPIIYLPGWFVLPETHSFLIRKNKLEMAKKSLCFYRNQNSKSYKTDDIDLEFSKLEESLKNSNKNNSISDNISWNELVKNPMRKAIIIGVVLASLSQLCGIFAMLNFTATIFETFGSDLPPNASAIVIAVIQVLGGFVSMYLVDKIGRKILMITSACCIGSGQLIMGIYSYLKYLEYDFKLQWIPLLCFSVIIFSGAVGVLSLPFVIISEIMPEKIKASTTSLCVSLIWIFSFLTVKYFTALTEALGMHGVMFLFSSISFSGMIFAIFALPETKGKSFDEILKTLM